MNQYLQIEIQHIKKSYQRKEVLRDVSFTLQSGECIGILGGNGSGKSTLLSILGGVQAASGGKFLVEGADLLLDGKKRAATVGYVPQESPLLEELSAKDNLLLWYEKKQMEQELKNGVLAMLGIGVFFKQPVSRLSGGMKKRLTIGCAMAGNPSVLLLDEPSAALDLIGRERIANYLKEYKAQGGAVILATHDVQEFSLCDRLFILKDGRLKPYKYDGNVHLLVGQL